ncbi:uncharacterized protein [Diadema antillarum]|uniref:uncharacterized protein n=1 Tax=Diadema antillarum TaxID=105358 RepID=UPI003A84552C
MDKAAAPTAAKSPPNSSGPQMSNGAQGNISDAVPMTVDLCGPGTGRGMEQANQMDYGKSLLHDGSALSTEPLKEEKGDGIVSPHLGETANNSPLQEGPAGDATSSSNKRMLTLDAAMEDITQNVKVASAQWTQVFMESEQFEAESSTVVEKLIQDAKSLEGRLLQQKERLVSHLRRLSQTLKVP